MTSMVSKPVVSWQHASSLQPPKRAPYTTNQEVLGRAFLGLYAGLVLEVIQDRKRGMHSQRTDQCTDWQTLRPDPPIVYAAKNNTRLGRLLTDEQRDIVEKAADTVNCTSSLDDASTQVSICDQTAAPAPTPTTCVAGHERKKHQTVKELEHACFEGEAAAYTPMHMAWSDWCSSEDQGPPLQLPLTPIPTQKYAEALSTMTTHVVAHGSALGDHDCSWTLHNGPVVRALHLRFLRCNWVRLYQRDCIQSQREGVIAK